MAFPEFPVPQNSPHLWDFASTNFFPLCIYLWCSPRQIYSHTYMVIQGTINWFHLVLEVLALASSLWRPTDPYKLNVPLVYQTLHIPIYVSHLCLTHSLSLSYTCLSICLLPLKTQSSLRTSIFSCSSIKYWSLHGNWHITSIFIELTSGVVLLESYKISFW